jgi:hypothetical protein
MDRTTFEREATLHRQVYETLRDQIKSDHAGKYVALAQGRLVAVTDTFDEAAAAVNLLEPVPEYSLIFPAEIEPSFELAFDL